MKLQDALGKLVGVFGGGRSQVTAAAASAKLTQEINETRTTLLEKFRALGAKIGPTVGSDYFEALAAGARPTAADARAQESAQLFGVQVDPRQAPKLAAMAGLALVGVFILYKLIRK